MIINTINYIKHFLNSELIVKYNICLKTLLQLGMSEPVLCYDLDKRIKRIVGKPNFSDQFKKIIKRLKKWDTTWMSCDSLHAW